MSVHRYRIVNVFVPDRLRGPSALQGNPLCVFEDGRGLDDAAMMALTRQFNLSETTFILPSDDDSTARVRIFTPTSDPATAEMRFAGHPSLGTSHVLRALDARRQSVVLRVPAGQVPVSSQGDVWTLTAPFSGSPGVRVEPSGAAAVAACVGLQADDLAGPPTWINTGTEQLIVPVRDAERVHRASPSAAHDWAQNQGGRANIYLFAFDGQAGDGHARVVSRFFIQAPGVGIFEDPGTGSACANLGGWLLANEHPRPARVSVDQGLAMQRHCRLQLTVEPSGKIHVGGRVVDIAQGELTLPDL